MLDHLQRVGAGLDVVFFGVGKVHGASCCSCQATAAATGLVNHNLICFAAGVSTSFFLRASGVVPVCGFRLGGLCRLQGRDFFAQRRELGLHGLEFVTADQIELSRHLVGLGAESGLGLVAGGLRKPERGVGQLGELVEKGVLGLHAPLYGKRKFNAKGLGGAAKSPRTCVISRRSTVALVFPDFNPIIVQVGPFALRWYALAYVAGIMLGWRYGVGLVRNARLWGPRKPTATVAQIDDLVLWITIGVIVGGRLGYVLFYMLPSVAERTYLFAHPLELFEIWHGGMSFHGGAIGVALAVIGFARVNRIDVLLLADLVAPCQPI